MRCAQSVRCKLTLCLGVHNTAAQTAVNAMCTRPHVLQRRFRLILISNGSLHCSDPITAKMPKEVFGVGVVKAFQLANRLRTSPSICALQNLVAAYSENCINGLAGEQQYCTESLKPRKRTTWEDLRFTASCPPLVVLLHTNPDISAGIDTVAVKSL